MSAIRFLTIGLAGVIGTAASLWAHADDMPADTTRQDMVHQMGHEVMPFSLDKTSHIFTTNDTGGVQKVLAQSSEDKEQVALIQNHLLYESVQFQQGNFADPTRLHGEDMPGLKTMEEGSTRIRIQYERLPAGAQITYSSDDPKLVEAIHDWFKAQLDDHGADAKPQ
ncbi:hypothetical protein [Pokkaliibacter plantistimulans]|uniref:hypothetical protein n=1 Tax=Pokkaliibacter plantistimulans TaxID=1635171 RepID=UPI001A9C7DDE|nr:hypothetical protein [Pokkaliibacter plantistimulans]